MKNFLTGSVLLLACFFSDAAPASLEKNMLSFGVGIGVAASQGDGVETGGVALSGEYDRQLEQYSLSVGVVGVALVDALMGYYHAGVIVRRDWMLSNRWSIAGKLGLGFAYEELKDIFNIGISSSDTSVAGLFGAGVFFAVTDHLRLGLNYDAQVSHLHDQTLLFGGLTLGLSYNF